jgi:hypothetical protein
MTTMKQFQSIQDVKEAHLSMKILNISTGENSNAPAT